MMGVIIPGVRVGSAGTTAGIARTIGTDGTAPVLQILLVLPVLCRYCLPASQQSMPASHHAGKLAIQSGKPAGAPLRRAHARPRTLNPLEP